MELNIWGVEYGLPEDELTTTEHQGYASTSTLAGTPSLLDIIAPLFLRKAVSVPVAAPFRQHEIDQH